MTYTKETTMEKGTKATCTRPAQADAGQGVAWLPIPGWPGYEVSDCAEPKVRNVRTGKVQACILNAVLYRKGYRRFSVRLAKALWCARHGVDPSEVKVPGVCLIMKGGEPTATISGAHDARKMTWHTDSPERQRFFLAGLAAFRDAQLRYLDGGDTAAMAAFLRGYKGLATGYLLRFKPSLRSLGDDAISSLLEETIAVICEGLRSGDVMLSTPDRAIADRALVIFRAQRSPRLHVAIEAINARRGGGGPWS